MKPLLHLLLLAVSPVMAAPAAPAACPQLGEQLTEYLGGAKQRIGFNGEVRVEFDVDAEGRPRVVALTGSRQYQVPVRIALQSVVCERGTPQRYVLNIRFADLTPRTVAAAASAPIAQATPR